VTYSRGFRLLLIAVLPVSLLFKLAAQPDDPPNFGKRIVTFLDRHSLTVSAGEETLGGIPTIRATADKCRILVIRTEAPDADWDIVRNSAAGDDRVFIVFRGKTYDDLPKWPMIQNYLWSRLRHELAIIPYLTPTLAVIASPNCHAERLPWRELWEQADL